MLSWGEYTECPTLRSPCFSRIQRQIKAKKPRSAFGQLSINTVRGRSKAQISARAESSARFCSLLIRIMPSPILGRRSMAAWSRPFAHIASLFHTVESSKENESPSEKAFMIENLAIARRPGRGARQQSASSDHGPQTRAPGAGRGPGLPDRGRRERRRRRLFRAAAAQRAGPGHELRRADLPEVMALLHRRGVRGYVTLNTLVFPRELPDAGGDGPRAGRGGRRRRDRPGPRAWRG